MKIGYISYNKKRKRKWLVITLFFLVFIYFFLQYFETNETYASKVEFETNIKDMKFVLGGELCGIKLLATGVLVVEVDNNDLDLKVGDVILKLDDTVVDSNQEIIDYINKEEIVYILLDD